MSELIDIGQDLTITIVDNPYDSERHSYMLMRYGATIMGFYGEPSADASLRAIEHYLVDEATDLLNAASRCREKRYEMGGTE